MVLGFPVPFHLSNEDACVDSGVVCPMPAGQKQSFLADIPIKDYYPPMAVTVKLQLIDPDTGVDVVCQYINTRLV